MQLTKFRLNDAQYANFERWLLDHYDYKHKGIKHKSINLDTANRFLGHHWGVRLLAWHDSVFVTMTPANAGFFILAMSNTRDSMHMQ